MSVPHHPARLEVSRGPDSSANLPTHAFGFNHPNIQLQPVFPVRAIHTVHPPVQPLHQVVQAGYPVHMLQHHIPVAASSVPLLNVYQQPALSPGRSASVSSSKPTYFNYAGRNRVLPPFGAPPPMQKKDVGSASLPHHQLSTFPPLPSTPPPSTPTSLPSLRAYSDSSEALSSAPSVSSSEQQDTTTTVPPSWPISHPKRQSPQPPPRAPSPDSDSESRSGIDDLLAPFVFLPTYPGLPCASSTNLPPSYDNENENSDADTPTERQHSESPARSHVVNDNTPSTFTVRNIDARRAVCISFPPGSESQPLSSSPSSFDFHPVTPSAIGPTLRRRMDRTLPRVPSLNSDVDAIVPHNSDEMRRSQTNTAYKLNRNPELQLAPPVPITAIPAPRINYTAPVSALRREDPAHTLRARAIRVPSTPLLRQKDVLIVVQFGTLFVYADNEKCLKYDLRKREAIMTSIAIKPDVRIMIRDSAGRQPRCVLRIDDEDCLQRLLAIATHYQVLSSDENAPPKEEQKLAYGVRRASSFKGLKRSSSKKGQVGAKDPAIPTSPVQDSYTTESPASLLNIRRVSSNASLLFGGLLRRDSTSSTTKPAGASPRNLGMSPVLSRVSVCSGLEENNGSLIGAQEGLTPVDMGPIGSPLGHRFAGLRRGAERMKSWMSARTAAGIRA
ncbi:hypothetical protein BJ742DRAFT_734551 [Cladochytrium replicatum]|nr:hypothetical protein BJ742DRAFT_734551 [Cladochytrium replicatum]